MMSGVSIWAQPADGALMGMPVELGMTILFVLFFLAVILVALLLVVTDLGRYTRRQLLESGDTKMPWIIRLFGIFDGDSTSFTGVNEDVVMEDHDYDGIQEYDNDLPPWWKYLFYITIVFGVVYFANYQFFHLWGEATQAAEYAAEEAEAKEKYANVDLVYDAPSNEASDLVLGEQMFLETCKACHGDKGQGGIGANLTDKNWIYGYNINEVYHTIKYGGDPGSGMQAWESDFNNEQVYQLASYILSLEYAEGKEAQGDIVQE